MSEASEFSDFDDKEQGIERKHKLVALAFFVLAFVVIASSVAVIILHPKDETPSPPPDDGDGADEESMFRIPPGGDIIRSRTSPKPAKTCDTDDCNYMRWLIEMSVDTKKDPCANFYTYVCTGAIEHMRNIGKGQGSMLSAIQWNNSGAIEAWMKNSPVPSKHQSGFQKVAKLFQSCTKDPDSSKQAIVDTLRNLRMIIDGTLDFDPLDVQVYLLLLGIPIIFEMSPFAIRHRNEIIFKLCASTDFASFRANSLRSAALRKRVYEKVSRWVFGDLGFNDTIKDRILLAEEEAHRASRNQTNDDTTYEFDMSRIDQFSGGDQALVQRWSGSLGRWFPSIFPGNYRLLMTLTDVHLFIHLFGSEPLISTGDFQTFFAWRMTWFLYNASGKNIEHKSEAYKSLRCSDHVLRLLNTVAPVKVMLGKVDQSRIAAVKEMAEVIRSEITVSFRISRWLDPATRSAALRKISQVIQHVGYPLGFSSEDAVETYLKPVPDMTDSYISNMMKMTSLKQSTLYDMLRRKGNFDWFVQYQMAASVPVYSGNAVYSATLNEIFIAPGIMGRPIFTYGGPPEVNYGALGNIVAHEFMHGFDESGRNYDGVGKAVDLFTEASKQAYADLVGCHNVSIERAPKARSYSDYAREYLADTMATATVLRAFKKASRRATVTLGTVKGFTSEQLFYVARCLVWCGVPQTYRYHPPSDERCNVPLMSSEHFGKAFNCPLGSPMNPPRKCVFW
ncbi:neprilysin-1-like [Ornithodoros turicata]|uniref:neprilysin-1-like n=1 Tax=Ornithodoros turicata TaxID=34597 RepID=UPI00313937ED